MPKLTINKFLGLNNVTDKSLLNGLIARERGYYLSKAYNIFINSDWKISLFNNIRKIIPLSNIHSIWSDGNLCLFRHDQFIYRLEPTLKDITPIVKGLNGSLPMSFLRLDSSIILFSDGVNRGRIIDGNFVKKIGCQIPDGIVFMKKDSGYFPPGDYYFVASCIRDDGMEGPTTDMFNIISDTPFGIRVVLPELDEDIKSVRIYVASKSGIDIEYDSTAPSGIVSGKVKVKVNIGDMVYRLLATIPANNKEAVISNISIIDESPVSMGLVNASPSNIMELFMSRLWYSEGNVLYYSEPFRYEVIGAVNFLYMDDYITDMISDGERLYVNTNSGVYSIDKDFNKNLVDTEPFIPRSFTIVNLSKFRFVSNLQGIGVIGVKNSGVSIIYGESVIELTNNSFVFNNIDRVKCFLDNDKFIVIPYNN